MRALSRKILTPAIYARTHEKFRSKKMTCEEVIEYIAEHDEWRREINGDCFRTES